VKGGAVQGGNEGWVANGEERRKDGWRVAQRRVGDGEGVRGGGVRCGGVKGESERWQSERWKPAE
jgi:hypothetical protein